MEFFEKRLHQSIAKNNLTAAHLDWIEVVHEKNLKMEDHSLQTTNTTIKTLKELLEFNYLLGMDVFFCIKDSKNNIYFIS